VAQGVADWLAEQGEGVHGLRPLAYVAEDAAVLYPRLGGVPLSDYARRPSGVVARCLKQAGAALSTLHHIPAALAGRPEPHDLEAEIRVIKHAAEKSHYIPGLLPQVRPAIEALLDRARELNERLPQEPPTFTHGDLKTEHLWVSAGGITVMDFDSSRPADPALDVGYFLADWQFLQAAYDPAGAEETYKSFLAGYAPGVPKERILRARLYEALELIKCVRRTQLFERDWASRVTGLVGRAEALMNDLQRTLGSPRRSLPVKPAILPGGAEREMEMNESA
jgi:aminoglycoside phosphotransferase (APT) family kinase protein